jgi:hypothetical protein
MDGQQLIEKWQDVEKAYHFEMNTKNLEKLCDQLGYTEDMFGSAVQNFLNDNPGAQQAIVDWVAEQLNHNEDWCDNFRDAIGDKQDDEEE